MIKAIKSKKNRASERIDCKFYDISYSINEKKIILGANSFIKIDGNEYHKIQTAGKGGNATVLLLTPTSSDTASPIALKLSSFFLPERRRRPRISKKTNTPLQRLERFQREIEALYKVKKEQGNTNIIEIFDHGEVEVPLIDSEKTKVFPFYTMEQADKSLKDSLQKEGPFLLQQKILLCQSLYNNLKALHDIGIYHRDIKSDNILYCNDTWKLGDLGLIDYRDEDDVIDGKYEKIGPLARLSPEATNKYLGIRQLEEYSFDHVIDSCSDIFQLGLLFWYICQGEVPVGNLDSTDFYYYEDYPELYDDILLPMLQYAKDRRPSHCDLDDRLSSIAIKLGA